MGFWDGILRRDNRTLCIPKEKGRDEMPSSRKAANHSWKVGKAWIGCRYLPTPSRTPGRAPHPQLPQISLPSLELGTNSVYPLIPHSSCSSQSQEHPGAVAVQQEQPAQLLGLLGTLRPARPPAKGSLSSGTQKSISKMPPVLINSNFAPKGVS